MACAEKTWSTRVSKQTWSDRPPKGLSWVFQEENKKSPICQEDGTHNSMRTETPVLGNLADISLSGPYLAIDLYPPKLLYNKLVSAPRVQ
jgi:hypothetical protein